MKLGAIILWIAVSVCSCYLTVESFYLLLEKPRWVLWILALAFFAISSFGTKLIYDSLNANNNGLEKEKSVPYFIGGFFLVLIFWGIFSLPTNTHTLFLQEKAKEICISDLENTKIELNNIPKEYDILIKNNDKKIRVQDLLTELKQEYTNPYRRGFGRRCDSLCYALEQVLAPERDWKLPQRGTNPKEDIKRIEEAADSRLESLLITTTIKRKTITDEELKEIEKISNSITGLVNAINRDKISEDQIIIKTTARLKTAYPKLKEYKGDAKYEVYKSKTAQLKNVYGVLFSWFQGDLKGQGYAIWFVISILIDLSGFIFFTVAFKKSNGTFILRI
ncbi:MAG: hypothetical protein IIX43_05410 [Bacteroidales bacterium]|nr:hypothetical protein [Bacteroidales bacterium]